MAATFRPAAGRDVIWLNPTSAATISSRSAGPDARLSTRPGTGDPITFTYLWSDGTIGDTDVLSAADVGQAVSVIGHRHERRRDSCRLTAQRMDRSTLPAAPVLDASGPSPAIAGTAQQGVTLSVSSGNWDNDPTQFGYVWEDCDGTGTVCVPIERRGVGQLLHGAVDRRGEHDRGGRDRLECRRAGLRDEQRHRHGAAAGAGAGRRGAVPRDHRDRATGRHAERQQWELG